MPKMPYRHRENCMCHECYHQREVDRKVREMQPRGYTEVDIPEEFEWWKAPDWGKPIYPLTPVITTDNTNVLKFPPEAPKPKTPAVTVDNEMVEDLLESVQKLKWEIVELRRELADDRRSRAQAANPEGFGESFEETIGDGHEGESEG